MSFSNPFQGIGSIRVVGGEELQERLKLALAGLETLLIDLKSDKIDFEVLSEKMLKLYDSLGNDLIKGEIKHLLQGSDEASKNFEKILLFLKTGKNKLPEVWKEKKQEMIESVVMVSDSIAEKNKSEKS